LGKIKYWFWALPLSIELIKIKIRISIFLSHTIVNIKFWNKPMNKNTQDLLCRRNTRELEKERVLWVQCLQFRYQFSECRVCSPPFPWSGNRERLRIWWKVNGMNKKSDLGLLKMKIRIWGRNLTMRNRISGIRVW